MLRYARNLQTVNNFSGTRDGTSRSILYGGKSFIPVWHISRYFPLRENRFMYILFCHRVTVMESL